MRQTIWVLALLTSATPAAAQWTAVEVGVGVSRACIGSEGGLCGEERGAMWATHASAWIDDRVEVGVRLAILPRDDGHYTIERDSRFDLSTDPVVRALPRIDVSVWDRSRRLLSAEAMYHFARGRPVRLFLGGGIGQRTNRGLSSCAPAGCERLLSFLSSPVGRYASADTNITIIAGISGRLSRRLYVRGGTRLHNFGGEGFSTAEMFVSTSYRFW
jgi:hypothetical protein